MLTVCHTAEQSLSFLKMMGKVRKMDDRGGGFPNPSLFCTIWERAQAGGGWWDRKEKVWHVDSCNLSFSLSQTLTSLHMYGCIRIWLILLQKRCLCVRSYSICTSCIICFFKVGVLSALSPWRVNYECLRIQSVPAAPWRALLQHFCKMILRCNIKCTLLLIEDKTIKTKSRQRSCQELLFYCFVD